MPVLAQPLADATGRTAPPERAPRAIGPTCAPAPAGHTLGTVTFPPADVAAIGRGYSCAAASVRRTDDLAALSGWLSGPRDRPMLLHAKVARNRPSWWLAEALPDAAAHADRYRAV
ncbi:hypothetical protein [Actinomadura napierensis]|uniref:GNAT family N-acetyltransferase n=1 Tax=Actinomadura napierensis TaxID=267854 RepID=A0ABP5M7R6_9ACTN